jgi:hypothetical protein
MKPACGILLFFCLAWALPGSAQTKIYEKHVFQKKWTQRSVLSQPRGFRPDPGIYLRHKYMHHVLRKFHGGASFLMLADAYQHANGVVGNTSDCQYVYTRREMDDILANSKGNSTRLEKELCMSPGSLGKKKLMRIDVGQPKRFNLRIPNGNEPGVPENWTPGGRFPNGYMQAVISRVPKSEVTATPVP